MSRPRQRSQRVLHDSGRRCHLAGRRRAPPFVHASERRAARRSGARPGRRAGAQVETAAPRRMERSAATPLTAAALSRWTTTSSHDVAAAPGAIATRDCASWRRIARAIACASLRQRRCSSSVRWQAALRGHRAHASDAPGSAESHFCEARRRRRSIASATRRPDARQQRSNASAHHSGLCAGGSRPVAV